MSSASGPHPGHPNAFLEAVERLRKAIARIPEGIADASRAAGARPSYLPADLARLQQAFARALKDARKSAAPHVRRARKAARSVSRWRKRNARSWAGRYRNAGRRWARNVASARKSIARRRKNFGRSWARFARNAGRPWKRARKNFGRSWARFARNAGRPWKRARRRLRIAARRPARKFARRVGASGIGGLSGRGMLGAVGPAIASIVAAGNAIQKFSENVADSNRHLAPFSGQLSAAYGRLEIGGMMRRRDLARFDERAGAAVVDEVNKLRDSDVGLRKIREFVRNRQAILGAKIIGPAKREINSLFEQVADGLARMDPDGKKAAGWVDSIFSNTSGAVGYWMAGGVFNNEAAVKAFAEAKKQWEMDQAAGKPHRAEGWDLFLQSAQAMPRLNPPRDWKP